MSGFSLAGLLRLRGVQERAAAERLSRARIASDQAEARERRARAALSDTGETAVDVRTLAAIASARASARARISDLSLLNGTHREELEAARLAHSEAKRAARGLEKLEEAFTDRERFEALRVEQTAIDEIATNRWMASGSREGAA
ncbi:hypothetical protein ACOKGD_04995 [Microbacterium phosphatis]|uniref:hypothetical protein n=1 Tax=Microbacterium phosphatis TaxID=3140248 RepID=UPI00313FF1C3